MSKHKKSKFLLGVVVGAAAALFLAPKKGSELREDAGKRYNDFKEDPQTTVINTFSDVKDFSTDKFNEVKEKFDSGEYSADKAKNFLIDKRDAIKEKIDSGDLSADSVKDFFNKTKDSLAANFQFSDSAEDDEVFDESNSDSEVSESSNTADSEKDESLKEEEW